MCKRDPSADVGGSLQKGGTALGKPGKQRLKIWELPASYHCPIVGVCLPLAVLRRLVNKSLHGETLADDYEIHVGAVNECIGKSRLSKAIQDELDRRHAQSIHQLRHARTAAEIAAYWRDMEAGGDVAGAFWAALTHPNCDYMVREEICKYMHMLQHQTGARAQLESGRFEALASEHRILLAELGKVQARCTALLDQKHAEIASAQKQLLEARGTLIRKETEIAALRAGMAALPDLSPRLELKQRVAELTAHLQQRNRELLQAQRTIEELREKAAAFPEHDAPSKQPQVGLEDADFSGATPLESKTVLCVGGRTGVVSRYRDCVENFGGQFAHHDGGMEDSMSQLDSTLAAADVVICQTGCISHGAYWRVKDYCKRTGKRCVFVDTPGTTSFSRILLKISGAKKSEAGKDEDAIDEKETRSG